ncbi:MAG TPA: hypothetical protein PKL67_16420, partial [Anaerolineae bacterium]|nr:hypothetical protein [Anaerolineae bacterium]
TAVVLPSPSPTATPTETPPALPPPSPTASATPPPTATIPAPAALLAEIQAPLDGDLLSGQVAILGTAGGSAFASYSLEVLLGEVWTPLAPDASPVTTPTSGVLGLWDTTLLPNGPTVLRLIVNGLNGELAVDTVSLGIGN